MNTNTNLSLSKAASDLAFSTVNDSAIAVDQSTAAQGAALELTDAQYAGFKVAVNQFRQIYRQSLLRDTQIAAQAEAAAKRAVQIAAAKRAVQIAAAKPAPAPTSTAPVTTEQTGSIPTA